jgi:hypothetical protein
MIELQIGDIIAIHNNSGFLPKGIQFFMKRWAKIHYGKKLDKYYNHTMTVVWKRENNVVVAEAVAKGYVITDLNIHNKTKDVLVFRLKEQLTEREKEMVSDKANEMAYGNIEYEILNFAWWMPYILSNGKIDMSPKNKEKRVFCFEASAILLNAARHLFDKPDKVTTVDLQFDDRFEQLIIENQQEQKS